MTDRLACGGELIDEELPLPVKSRQTWNEKSPQRMERCSNVLHMPSSGHHDNVEPKGTRDSLVS
jgi:hypothetical protein